MFLLLQNSGWEKGRLKISDDLFVHIDLRILFNQRFGQFLQRHAFGFRHHRHHENELQHHHRREADEYPTRPDAAEQERNGGGNGGKTSVFSRF